MIRRAVLLAAALLLLPAVSSGLTFDWGHDLIATTGFRLYYGQSPGQNTFLVAAVAAPQLAVTLEAAPEGYYIVKAYNDNGESDPSNEVILAAYYYNAIRYEYDASGRVLYKGEHTVQNAATNDPNWVISRYDYIGSAITQIRIRTTSWDNRALGW